MFYAKNLEGDRVHIDNSMPSESYFCPVCNNSMIRKCGEINAHHFAHKSQNSCDPWYTGKLSPWHSKMQNHFKQEVQEVVIWNTSHTEYHIADIALQSHAKRYIIEFQHSSISSDEFIARSKFYTECGYFLIWVFDFCQCSTPKKIFIDGIDEYENSIRHFVWPGRDRVKLFDIIDLAEFRNKMRILFHINTGIGRSFRQEYEGYPSWEKWEYLNPLRTKPCFVSVLLDQFVSTTDFYAKYFTEEAFFKRLRKLERDYA